MSMRLIVTLTLLAGCAGNLERRKAPESITTQQMLDVATVLEQSGDSVRAEQYLHAAMKSGADDRLIVPHLLRMYASDGQYRLAIEQGEHYLRRHPNHHAVRLLLAALYSAVGADTLAAQEYERVLIAEPDHAEAHFALATVLYDAGRQRDRADQHFRSYLSLEPAGRYAEEARALLLKEVVE